jgi:hypothetical protein
MNRLKDKEFKEKALNDLIPKSKREANKTNN